MKKQHRYILFAAFVAMLAIVCYQAYWLTDIYHTLQNNLRRDIQESMRAADFQEISHRVEILKQMEHGGEMNISVGVDESHDKAVVSNEYFDNASRQDMTETEQDTVSNRIAYDDFANALRTEDDVRDVGLQMQRGIHSGLDRLLPTDPAYYDSLLSIRLDSLNVKPRHTSLLLKSAVDGCAVDTLYASDIIDSAQTYEFRLTLNAQGDEEYVLFIKRSVFLLPPQMRAPIIFSIFTLLILVVAFWYIISMLRRMWVLDEMKSDFTNNITHELKTPIAVAYAANDALLNHNNLCDTEKVRKYLAISQEQLSLLSNLVEQILSLSMEQRKNMQLNLEEVEVLPVIEKVVSNHQVKSHSALDIQIDVPENICLTVDRLHFTNIINNLVDNAIKYSHNNIHIEITAQKHANGDTTISVKDQGIGISAQSQQYIFDKFYRVPHGNLHDVKGYGLGLFYVKNLMQRFGGDVSVQSVKDMGSTFTLVFHG